MNSPSMNQGIWTSSKEASSLTSPTNRKTTSSMNCEGIAKQNINDYATAFNNTFSHTDINMPNSPGVSQVDNTQNECHYEIVSEGPFSNINNPPSSEISRMSPVELGKNRSSFEASYQGETSIRHNSVTSNMTASPKFNNPNTSHWLSRSAPSDPNNNHDADSHLSTPSLFAVVPGPSSTSYLTMPNTNAFPNHHFQSAGLVSLIPPAENFQYYSKEDEVCRLERVLEAIDEAGFDSVDSMVAAYYTSTIPPRSPIHSAQTLSKQRHLKRLLASLHESAKSWNAQELQSFREGIMRSAEDILIDEMQALDLNSIKEVRSGEVFGKLESLFASKESQEVTKENKRVFKVRVSKPRIISDLIRLVADR
jgi:hypothetical protein